jgi:hypothetical protein
MVSFYKWMTGMLMIILSMGAPVCAQGPLKETGRSPAASKPSQPAKPTKVKRIIILGTTIVGSIAKPRTVYEVPWKEPESLKKGLDAPQRSFQDEIFILIDKEQFESQKESQQ